MSIEELKVWFFSIFNNCYPVKNDNYPYNIFWYYDEKFTRKIKLCKLSNINVELPLNLQGECFFVHDIKNMYLYCDYEKIWAVFYEKYSFNYDDVQTLIKSWFEEESKINIFTPKWFSQTSFTFLLDESKMGMFIPYLKHSSKSDILENWCI